MIQHFYRGIVSGITTCTLTFGLVGSLAAQEQQTASSITAPQASSGSPMAGYLTFAELEQRLQGLAQSSRVDLQSLGKTIQDRDVWLVKIGEVENPDQPDQNGRRRYKPAILVLGNVHAPHLLGRELALRMAESLVADAADQESAAHHFLDRFTVYMIPCPSPDASEKNLQAPYREIAGNAVATDDDRDFDMGEDAPTDLNQDGWITMMRIEDSLGTHRAHPDNPLVMIPVDRKLNEPAGYRMLVESRDNDRDDQFGEDGSDGIDFNRNFTFNYDFFGKGTGPHQVSEIETRAVADFAFENPNIAVVFCFSPEDNLFHPWKGTSQSDAARIKKNILTGDTTYQDYLAKKFQELHGGKDAPSPPKGAGSFSEWAYFHYGRWSFASRGWWIPKVETKQSETQPTQPKGSEETELQAESTAAASTDTSNDAAAEIAEATETSERVKTAETAEATETAEEVATSNDSADFASENKTAADSTFGEISNKSSGKAPALPKGDKRGQDDLNALAWFAQNNIPGFVDWTPFGHPDLPDQKVEIGGFKPFYRLNPPANEIDSLVSPHVQFMFELDQVWPALEIRDFKATRLAPGLYDVSCQVVNKGFLPTMPEMGRVTREAYPIQVMLSAPENVNWIEGSPRQAVGRLNGQGGKSELRWVFQLKEPTADIEKFTLSTWSPTLHDITVETEVHSADTATSKDK